MMSNKQRLVAEYAGLLVLGGLVLWTKAAPGQQAAAPSDQLAAPIATTGLKIYSQDGKRLRSEINEDGIHFGSGLQLVAAPSVNAAFLVAAKSRRRRNQAVCQQVGN